MGLPATDAWRRAAVNDGLKIAPFRSIRNITIVRGAPLTTINATQIFGPMFSAIRPSLSPRT